MAVSCKKIGLTADQRPGQRAGHSGQRGWRGAPNVPEFSGEGRLVVVTGGARRPAERCAPREHAEGTLEAHDAG